MEANDDTPTAGLDIVPRDDTVLVQHSGQELLRIRAVPDRVSIDSQPASAAAVAALGSLAAGSPDLAAAIRQAAQNGKFLQVTFPKGVIVGLRTGTLRLAQSSTGQIPTAVDGAGRFVTHARVVGGAGVGAASGLKAGVALTAVGVALPIAIAGAAAYAQQRRLEQALESIQAVVDRIESRLRDADYGACEAAEGFLTLAASTLDEGGLTDELRHELSVHRASMEALFAARRRWARRFKAELERQQTEKERDSGKRQPWVDAVIDAVKNDRFDDELLLFLRSLVCRTKLNALAAICLADAGRPRAALELIATTERELRAEFFDFHNRLAPLARIEPELNLVKRLPGLRTNITRAQSTVKELVQHIDAHVLPVIPDPDHERDVTVIVDPGESSELIRASTP